MPYIEYIRPSQELKEDIEKILEVGLQSGALDGLAERAKAIKAIESKWQGRLSQNFLKRLDEILQLAIISMDQTGKPVLPNCKSYDDIEEYSKDVSKAFNALSEYHDNKERIENAPSIDPGDRFVIITEKVKALVSALDLPQSTVIERDGSRYVIQETTEWPGHAVSEVHNKKHIMFMQEIVNQTKNVTADLTKFLMWDELPKNSRPVEDVEEQTTLLDVKFNELRAMAKQKGITVPVGTSKLKLIDMILEGSDDTEGTTGKMSD